MIKIGIIGYGYWGPNLVRNFNNNPNCEVVLISDLRKERISELSLLYPNIKSTTNSNDIIKNKNIDAVVIATPVHTHFKLTSLSLENGKHVLVEKPMASSVSECEELIQIAQKSNRVLMVDHTFLYTGAIKKMKELIKSKAIGNIKYFDSTRINLGLFQPDINVLWDLAPHDLSILFYLLDEFPYKLNATGISHTSNSIENIAYLTLYYKKSNLIAHINCSWSSPVKVRSTLIGGSEKMILYNDLEPTEKVKVYDTSVNHETYEDKRSIMVDYRVGDIKIPKIENREALKEVASDFIDSIKNNNIPLSNSTLGLNVVKVLEAANKSILNDGSQIIL